MVLRVAAQHLNKYYSSEEAAHAAASEESKTSPCGIFVRESASGFYLSPFGLPDSICYFSGHRDNEEFDREGLS